MPFLPFTFSSQINNKLNKYHFVTRTLSMSFASVFLFILKKRDEIKYWEYLSNICTVV